MISTRSNKDAIVITLDRDGAEFLAFNLPQSDGFTKDLHDAISEKWGRDGR